MRALLGLPKPKGNDEREPDDDDPPWPDVTVVVIINKRSGSRLVRTASRPVRVKRREDCPFASPPLSTSDSRFSGRPEARDPDRTAAHLKIQPQGLQLSRKLIEVSARRIVPSTARPERRRRPAYPSCQNIQPPLGS